MIPFQIKTQKQKRFSGRYFQLGVNFLGMEKMSVFQGLTCLEKKEKKKENLKSFKKISKFYIRRKKDEIGIELDIKKFILIK